MLPTAVRNSGFFCHYSKQESTKRGHMGNGQRYGYGYAESFGRNHELDKGQGYEQKFGHTISRRGLGLSRCVEWFGLMGLLLWMRLLLRWYQGLRRCVVLFFRWQSLVLVVCLISPPVALSQSAGSAEALGAGSTGIASVTGSSSFWMNPSLLLHQNPVISISRVQFAGMRELSSIRGSVVFGIGRMGWGAGIRRFGSDFYHRSALRLASAVSAGDLTFGMSGTYVRVFQGFAYNPLHSITVQAGMLIRLSDDVYAGFRANNLLQSRYFKTNERLPSDLAAGLGIRLHETLESTFDLVKDLRYPLSLRWGVVWEPVSNVRFLAGHTTRPETFSCGLSIRWDAWKGTFAFQQHTSLGITPAIDLEFLLP